MNESENAFYKNHLPTYLTYFGPFFLDPQPHTHVYIKCLQEFFGPVINNHIIIIIGTVALLSSPVPTCLIYLVTYLPGRYLCTYLGKW